MTSDKDESLLVPTDNPAAGSGASTAEILPTAHVDGFVGQWWVLHTHARNEKVVTERLVRRSIQVFLPLVRYRRTYGGRIKQVLIPLFPGYVFLCGSEADRLCALQTNRVAKVLEVPNQEQLKKDLHQIERVVSSDEPVDIYPRLRTGCRCRVIGGSLIGLEGVVLRRRGPWRVYIGVQFLGQSAELEIDRAMLEVVD